MSNYHEYLNSEWWINKRENSKKTKTVRRGCLVCGNSKVDLHHLTYKCLGKENIGKHIVALCRKHHKEFHEWQRLNNKLVGDVSEWMQSKYPKEWVKVKKHQKGKIKKYTSKHRDKQIRAKERERKNNFFNEILNSPGDSILLNEYQRSQLGEITHLMLNRLEIMGNSYEEKLERFINRPVNKDKLLDLLYNFEEYLIEDKRLKDWWEKNK